MEPQGHSKEDIQYYIKKKSLFEDTIFFRIHCDSNSHSAASLIGGLASMAGHVTTRM
jgi:hypothetical protein